MRSSGKLVVLSIFALAIGMASFALWWNWGMGRRSLDYWGENGALLIRDAKSVTLVKLKPPLPMNPRDLNTAEKKDISDVKGLVHARRAFLEDASFEWNEPLSAGIEWQYAVLFAGEKGHIFVMLDLKDGVVGSSERNQALHLNPKTASGWKLFISRYFPDEAPKTSQGPPAKAK
jgi:hypothetical protein